MVISEETGKSDKSIVLRWIISISWSVYSINYKYIYLYTTFSENIPLKLLWDERPIDAQQMHNGRLLH